MRLKLHCVPIVFAAVAWFTAGCNKQASGPSDQQGPQPSAKQGPPEPKSAARAPRKDLEDPNVLRQQAVGEPEVTLDAKAWQEEFTKDNKAAHAKYEGKAVLLTGVVETASGPNEFVPGGTITLEGPKGLGSGVTCGLKDKNPMARVSKGSQVKVKGIVYGTHGTLLPAEIVEAGKNPGIVISAEKLAEEYKADKAATKTKYYLKHGYVDGVVVENFKHRYEMTNIKLKGIGDVQVVAKVSSNGDSSAFALVPSPKVGQKVKIYGLFTLEEDSLEFMVVALLPIE
jgi:hypothetical protein